MDQEEAICTLHKENMVVNDLIQLCEQSDCDVRIQKGLEQAPHSDAFAFFPPPGHVPGDVGQLICEAVPGRPIAVKACTMSCGSVATGVTGIYCYRVGAVPLRNLDLVYLHHAAFPDHVILVPGHRFRPVLEKYTEPVEGQRRSQWKVREHRLHDREIVLGRLLTQAELGRTWEPRACVELLTVMLEHVCQRSELAATLQTYVEEQEALLIYMMANIGDHPLQGWERKHIEYTALERLIRRIRPFGVGVCLPDMDLQGFDVTFHIGDTTIRVQLKYGRLRYTIWRVDVDAENMSPTTVIAADNPHADSPWFVPNSYLLGFGIIAQPGAQPQNSSANIQVFPGEPGDGRGAAILLDERSSPHSIHGIKYKYWEMPNFCIDLNDPRLDPTNAEHRSAFQKEILRRAGKVPGDVRVPFMHPRTAADVKQQNHEKQWKIPPPVCTAHGKPSLASMIASGVLCPGPRRLAFEIKATLEELHSMGAEDGEAESDEERIETLTWFGDLQPDGSIQDLSLPDRLFATPGMWITACHRKEHGWDRAGGAEARIEYRPPGPIAHDLPDFSDASPAFPDLAAIAYPTIAELQSEVLRGAAVQRRALADAGIEDADIAIGMDGNVPERYNFTRLTPDDLARDYRRPVGVQSEGPALPSQLSDSFPP
ncbi:hypothetical protein WJX73_003376 [Symbiochloris irregularis]|uniref:Uncharacterized protein n=1 Tax=Symbiochloris irregularis TaxID=706552 RepID=A0AAW1P4N6_9CHLO